MAGIGLLLIGTKNSIPPGEIETEIAVVLGGIGRMMDPMHVRRYHYQSQPSVDVLGDADITVVEHRGNVKQHLGDYHRNESGPHDKNKEDLHYSRQQNR